MGTLSFGGVLNKISPLKVRMESYEPEWGFLNLNLHTNHTGVVLREDPGALDLEWVASLHFSQAPGAR